MQEPTKFCFQCGMENNLSAQFCQRCGARQVDLPLPVELGPPPAPEPQISLRNPVLWAITIILGLAFGGVLIFFSPGPPADVVVVPSPTPWPTPSPTPTPLPAELLAEAKKQMADAFCKYGCEAAARPLSLIPSDAKEYKEAKRLMAVLDQRHKQWEAIRKRDEEKREAEARKARAENVERGMLAKGYDMTVTVSGPRNTTIKITYVLMNRPLVYQLQESGLLEQLREQGFRRVIFSDGYDRSWWYDL